MTRPDLRIVPPVDYDTRPNLFEQLRAEQLKVETRRQHRLEHIIGTLAIWLALGCIGYFALQLLRGWLS